MINLINLLSGHNTAASKITVQVQNSRTKTFKGRDASALACLTKAGVRGCIPLEHPGPRWSAYVHKLRATGLQIETVKEKHSVPFAGSHARYVLHTILLVIDYEVA